MTLAARTLSISIRTRINNWFEQRNPPTKSGIFLHGRRLYILPTRFGYLFSVLLLVLFLAAINYENSLAFILTFMLTALAIVSLWHTHKNLLGLKVDLKQPKPVYSGEDCEFEFGLDNPNNSSRYAVGIQYANEPPVYLSISPDHESQAKLKIPTGRRGLFKPNGFTIFTRYPTGLFHAWGWLKFDKSILIYPRPVPFAELRESLESQYRGKSLTSTIEGDDFAGLREHRIGESIRHISWKAYAQGKGLLTKTFLGHASPSLWIDWTQLKQGSQEDKLAYMTSLVIIAENEKRKYGLRLPGKTIEQNTGNAHKHACLAEIATFRQADTHSAFVPDHVSGH